MSTEQDEKKQPVETEVVPQQTSVALPMTPFTIQELAVSEAGEAIVQRSIDLMRALRSASIAMTYPHDWVLFKADNRITGFCQDAGCDRFRDFWGIEIDYTKAKWERSEDPDTKDFKWSITASGTALRTGQTVHEITGVRYSYEDFITKRKLPKLQADEEVKKAARANLEGTIIRELAGMKSVPVEELDKVWAMAGMTQKKSEFCARGRGFGSQAERQGAQVQESTDLKPEEAPDCPACDAAGNPGRRMKYVAAGTSKTSGKSFDAFWSCPERTTGHKGIGHSEWMKTVEARRKAAAEEPNEH